QSSLPPPLMTTPTTSFSLFFSLLLPPPPPTSPLFPYTTLFRSWYGPALPRASTCIRSASTRPRSSATRRSSRSGSTTPSAGRPRSEEHTSELQSLTNLVCRLLLEKKKTKHNQSQHLTQLGRSHT